MKKNVDKSHFDESMVLEIVDQEGDERERATHMEYLDMIENIQQVLTNVENEKTVLRDENEELATALVKQNEKTSHLQKEHQHLQNAYDDLLSQMDLCNMKKTNIEKEKAELEAKLEDLNARFEKIQKMDAEDADKKLTELTETIETLTNENRTLQDRLSSMISAKSTTEDIRNITQSQLTELTDKYKKLSDENEKMKTKLDVLYKEKQDLTNMLEARVNELDDVKREYKNDLERISIEHASKIKELLNGGNQERGRAITGIGNTMAQGLTMTETNMGELNFEDNTDDVMHQDILKRQSIKDLLKRGSLALQSINDEYEPVYSNRTIDLPASDGLEEDIKYLDQIEEKDKEISKLREQITELKEKASNDNKPNPRQEEQIKKLTLDIKHEKERYEMLKETAKNEKEYAEKIARDIEEVFVQSKLKYQLESAEKDQEILNLIKKIKLLRYQINLYEDQINAFNKVSKKG